MIGQTPGKVHPEAPAAIETTRKLVGNTFAGLLLFRPGYEGDAVSYARSVLAVYDAFDLETLLSLPKLFSLDRTPEEIEHRNFYRNLLNTLFTRYALAVAQRTTKLSNIPSAPRLDVEQELTHLLKLKHHVLEQFAPLDRRWTDNGGTTIENLDFMSDYPIKAVSIKKWGKGRSPLK